MLFNDGFFHADLHPGNLHHPPRARGSASSISAWWGASTSDLRRTFLYYYYTLVMGDAEGAARYLARHRQPGAGGRSARGSAARSPRSSCASTAAGSFRDFSLAQLIMRSVNLGAQHRLYFPVEMVLMVKALVTFEGVGQILKPGLDVAAVSQEHANTIFRNQFSPQNLLKQVLRAGPGRPGGARQGAEPDHRGPAASGAGHPAPREPARRPARHPLRRLLHGGRRHPRRRPRPLAGLVGPLRRRHRRGAPPQPELRGGQYQGDSKCRPPKLLRYNSIHIVNSRAFAGSAPF